MVFPRSAAGLPYMCACPEKHNHFWRICPRISSRNLAVCYGKGSLYIQTRRNMLIFFSKLFNYQCLHVSCPGLMLGRWHFTWLVVSAPLKNISQWEGLLHILWKIKAMLETTNQSHSSHCRGASSATSAPREWPVQTRRYLQRLPQRAGWRKSLLRWIVLVVCGEGYVQYIYRTILYIYIIHHVYIYIHIFFILYYIKLN